MMPAGAAAAVVSRGDLPPVPTARRRSRFDVRETVLGPCVAARHSACRGFDDIRAVLVACSCSCHPRDLDAAPLHSPGRDSAACSSLMTAEGRGRVEPSPSVRVEVEIAGGGRRVRLSSSARSWREALAFARAIVEGDDAQ